ncbi:MAG: MFS transporter [Dehalococcoidia bacterium]|jgi:MFS family permease|nr:MFS transporter [Dehalococcoidia bacterium]MDP6228508.1 MFS transporter [Dehalococcoidia bacterium]MDP7084444.1 MFS transporter [Dehalococcoidia bacterium]MDP7200048.1 MFS transporter [Dehalococcoidia bacterium]MDP7512080.1 MFS transporter [Dehalococcoidia bacterium]
MQVSTQSSESRRGGRIFYGWWIVAVTSVQGMIGNGAISSGFPIFFEPIRTTLGIGYASMSLVLSLARAEGGMGGPLVGWLVDKFGGRPMILFGGLTAGVGLVLVSHAQTYWQFVLLFVGVVSVGKTAGLGQTLMATVNQWFIRRKAVAMSALMTSFAGGGAIVVPLLGLGIDRIGWRDTLQITGILIGLLTIPVALVVRSRPEDKGLRPDGDAAPLVERLGGPAGARSRREPGDFTVREATRTRTFWFMLLGVVARVSATNAIIIHIFPLLEDEGMSSGNAAIYVSVMFFMAIPLRFILGVAGGRVSPRKLLFVGMNLGALGLLALRGLDGTLGVVIFILAFGVVEGVTAVNWIMLGDYFGRSRFASLMGFMSVFHNMGMFVAPIFSGWVKDQTGSYNLVLIAFAPLFMASGLMFLLARRPPPPPVRVEEREHDQSTAPRPPQPYSPPSGS